MTDRYLDIGGSTPSASYTTWATAANDLETVLGVCGVGDRVYVRTTSGTDTAAIARTLTSPASHLDDAVAIIGVKVGAAEPPVAGDWAILGTDTLPTIETTGGSSAMTFSGSFVHHGINYETAASEIQFTVNNAENIFYRCDIDAGTGTLRGGNTSSVVKYIECTLSGNEFNPSGNASHCEIIGGTMTFTSSTQIFSTSGSGQRLEIMGCDLSGSTATALSAGGVNKTALIARNCKMVTSYTLIASAYTTYEPGFVECISCSAGTSKGNTESYKDYQFENYQGDIEINTTDYRTGGADDGATTAGNFVYKLTPNVDSTREGLAGISTRWFSVWVAGGSAITLTVYIANDSGADLNQDDVMCEFLVPDDSDTAAHDYALKAGYTDIFLDSATAIADDATSTWNGSAANGQKFTNTVTPGFEGFAYARVTFMKRYAATPDSLYVDPKIEVT